MGKRINIENQIYNTWKVLYRTCGSMYKCQCLLCGNTQELNSYKLRNNIAKKCTQCNNCVDNEKIESTIVNNLSTDEYNVKTDRESVNTSKTFEGCIINGCIVKEYLGNDEYKCQCYCKNLFVAKAYNIKKNKVYGCEQCTEEITKTVCIETMITKSASISNMKIINTKGQKQLGIINNKEGLEKFIEEVKLELKREPTSLELANRLGINCEVLYCYLRQYNINIYSNYISDKELELREQLKGVNGEYNNKTLLYPMEIDIYFPEQKIGIEFNSTYWHSELFKDKKYHQDKTILAAKNKIQLIHVFEYEWNDTKRRDAIIKFLKYKLGILKYREVYARKTKVVKVNSVEEREFLNNNHLQGYSASSVCYGLKYEDDIVALMSFGRPRFNKGYDWELVRLAYKEGVKVTGGAEKLFKAFLKEYDPENVVSYCDIARFNGGVYKRLGFTADSDDVTPPNYMWVNPLDNTVLPRYKTMKHKLISQGLGTEEDTENSIMSKLGYMKVHDCGNLRFTWKRGHEK